VTSGKPRLEPAGVGGAQFAGEPAVVVHQLLLEFGEVAGMKLAGGDPAAGAEGGGGAGGMVVVHAPAAIPGHVLKVSARGNVVLGEDVIADDAAVFPFAGQAARKVEGPVFRLLPLGIQTGGVQQQRQVGLVRGVGPEHGVPDEEILVGVAVEVLQLQLLQNAGFLMELLYLEMRRSLIREHALPFRVHIPGKWVEA